MTENQHEFVGRGFPFPMRVDHTGSIALTPGTDTDGSLRAILSTARGERLMRPQFGCKIWDLLFEPVTANTRGLMAEYVREAVAQWEPRVDLDEVRVNVDPKDSSRVLIELDYRIRATNDRRNLVYPFYVIPREGER